MKSEICFEYALNRCVSNIEQDVKELDWHSLTLLAEGSLFIFFERNRAYIRIKTGLIEYLNQFDIVIREIDSGNHQPFSVSGDYFSNSFHYNYDSKTDVLTISEANDAEFEIETEYSLFRSKYHEFRSFMISELKLTYKELDKNKVFMDWAGSIQD